jgi:hypothetical protein
VRTLQPGNLKETDYFGKLGVDRTVILKWMLKKKCEALNRVQLAYARVQFRFL